MALHFVLKHFSDLTVYELYDVLKLRQEVFVVEQNCPYLDNDGKDLDSWHLLGYAPEGYLAAYTRLLPLGLSYPEYASIGRVVTAPQGRGKGYGKVLMAESIAQAHALFNQAPLKIGAQSYLLAFYNGLGFVSTGEEYLEDGIPHTSMVLKT